MAETAATTVTDGATNDGQWATGLDDDTKAWVGGMGLDKLPADQALAKVLPMYRGAEQKLGVPADQILRLPGKDAKPEDWAPIWSKLGRPEKPEGYEIKPMTDQPDAFLEKALGKFHELGVPKSTAQGLIQMLRDHATESQTAAEGKWNERFEKEIGELKNEWGVDYDKNADLSKRVQRAFGLSNDELVSIERALGPKKFMQTFAKFGSTVGEHRFTGGAQTGFQMSPEAAKARIADLQKDSAWLQKYLGGDAEAKAEFTRLQQIANPEAIAA